MPKQFDATLKDLVQAHLSDFQPLLGLRGHQPVKLLNVDLSTVSAATDIVLAQGEPPARIVDLNFQSGPTDDARELFYNAALFYNYRVPVHSIIILLRPEADNKLLSGKIHYVGRAGRGRMIFDYEIIRLWRQPVQKFLQGGLGTLPLALLCKLPKASSRAESLKPIVHQIADRLEKEADAKDRNKLLSAAYILTGLRLPRETATHLFEGVRSMRESSTYQAILDEGRAEGTAKALQNTLLRLGRRLIGSPSKKVQAAIVGILDIERLERMTDRVLDVSSWQELLNAP